MWDNPTTRVAKVRDPGEVVVVVRAIIIEVGGVAFKVTNSNVADTGEEEDVETGTTRITGEMPQVGTVGVTIGTTRVIGEMLQVEADGGTTGEDHPEVEAEVDHPGAKVMLLMEDNKTLVRYNVIFVRNGDIWQESVILGKCRNNKVRSLTHSLNVGQVRIGDKGLDKTEIQVI